MQTTGEKCVGCGHADNLHLVSGCKATISTQDSGHIYCGCSNFESETSLTIKKLSTAEQRLLACAYYLHIKPETITETHITTLPQNQDIQTGIDVIVHIPITGNVDEWVKTHSLETAREYLLNWLAVRYKNEQKAGVEIFE